MIEMFDHGQVVLERNLTQRIILGRQQLLLPVIANTAGLFSRGAIVSQLMGVNTRQQFGAAPNKEDPLAQQSAQGPLVSRIDISRRDEVGAQQMSELF